MMGYSIRHRQFLIDEILNVRVVELSYGGGAKVYWIHCMPIIDVIYYDGSGKTTGRGMKHHSDVIEQVIQMMQEDVSPVTHVDTVHKQRLKPTRRVGRMYLNS